MPSATAIMNHQKQKYLERLQEWYNLRPILGCANWAIFFILLGGREVGKSYSVTNFFVDQFVNKGIPFKWIRLTDKQASKLLENNAMRLVDPDLRRKYNLDLVTRGECVYNVTKRSAPDKDGKTKILEKKLMAQVYDLSTFYSDKGSIFDKDFLQDDGMRYNIAIDEFQREKNERNTFDIAYALVNQLENLVRSTKDRIKVFFMGNTLEESSDILAMFNFIPETFGTFKLVKNKKHLVQYLKELKQCKTDAQRRIVDYKYKDFDFGKRAVIQYIEPSEQYQLRRKGTIADILMPTASTFTNKIEVDNTLVDKSRKIKVSYIIKFSKDKKDWFTVWNDNIICPYKNEQNTNHKVIPMRPYLDCVYNKDWVNNILQLFDTRCYHYSNLITFKQFQSQLSLLRKTK